MRADAAGEGCRDTAMLEIELGVTNLSIRIVPACSVRWSAVR